MYQSENMTEENKMSRADKVMQAKTAFLPGAQASHARRTQNTHAEKKKHSFGLLRMLVAGMLFLLLLTAFHFDISYQKFDREYVKELLADDSKWEKLVNQVTEVMKQAK
ncbi:MAG: hypothetical protein SO170_00810 [Butyribacter sp.]|nr:hypothetical protein [bacterium]MDY3853490.1 hypothetical protein [Butyribacter sp.]